MAAQGTNTVVVPFRLSDRSYEASAFVFLALITRDLITKVLWPLGEQRART